MVRVLGNVLFGSRVGYGWSVSRGLVFVLGERWLI